MITTDILSISTHCHIMYHIIHDTDNNNIVILNHVQVLLLELIIGLTNKIGHTYMAWNSCCLLPEMAK